MAELPNNNKNQFQFWPGRLSGSKTPSGTAARSAARTPALMATIVFKPDGKTPEKAIVSVQGGGNVSVTMIRDLGHVIEREKAKVGVFITLAEPTGPMRTEAIKAGFYETEFGKFPKIQILTIAELFDGNSGKTVDGAIRPRSGRTARKAASKQDSLPL